MLFIKPYNQTEIEYVLGYRGEGKTTELIKLSAEKYYYMVCADRKRVEYVWDLARKLELDIPFPLTFTEFLEKRYYSRGINGFLIDDVDDFLRYIEPGIRAVSFTTANHSKDIL